MEEQNANPDIKLIPMIWLGVVIALVFINPTAAATMFMLGVAILVAKII